MKTTPMFDGMLDRDNPSGLTLSVGATVDGANAVSQVTVTDDNASDAVTTPAFGGGDRRICRWISMAPTQTSLPAAGLDAPHKRPRQPWRQMILSIPR